MSGGNKIEASKRKSKLESSIKNDWGMEGGRKEIIDGGKGSGGSHLVANVTQWTGGGWVNRDRGSELGILASHRPAWLGPGAINHNLIEGYRGDPAVTKGRTEVVIEEEGPSLSLFPAQELRRLEQYWSWRGVAARFA